MNHYVVCLQIIYIVNQLYLNKNREKIFPEFLLVKTICFLMSSVDIFSRCRIFRSLSIFKKFVGLAWRALLVLTVAMEKLWPALLASVFSPCIYESLVSHDTLRILFLWLNISAFTMMCFSCSFLLFPTTDCIF